MMFKLWSRLFGSRFYCSVCRRKVERFQALDPFYSENATKYGYPYFGQGETINVKQYSCPHCGASDRERLYALYLEAIPEVRESEEKPRLLHFAPEGSLSMAIRHLNRFNYRTADLNVDEVDDRVDITNMDIYSDASFDAFICSHVLEHVQDDAAAMKELYRILKPSGWGILMVPLMLQFEKSLEDPLAVTEAERWRMFGQGDHVRLYAKHDFLARIMVAGFAVEQLGADYFGKKSFAICGISPRSQLYIVHKQYDRLHKDPPSAT